MAQLCAVCGSGSRCLTHDSNREAIDTGRPARTVGLSFDVALKTFTDVNDGDPDAGWDDDGDPWPDDVIVPTETIQPSEAYL